MTLHWRDIVLFCSSQELPRLGPLKGFLRCHSTLQGHLTRLVLLLELQRNEDTVRCAEVDANVSGQIQKQMTQTLIAFLENAFFALILDSER